ncbi:MAG: flagellar biosynthesis repressor FlbT [Hasllibacter sp.]
MTGLVLKLAPGERLLVNGAVLENGPRRAQVRIRSQDARILRMKDAQHPDEATTPVRRACLVAQMALSGDLDPRTRQPTSRAASVPSRLAFPPRPRASAALGRRPGPARSTASSGS